jgi:hypothetical protein
VLCEPEGKFLVWVVCMKRARNLCHIKHSVDILSPTAMQYFPNQRSCACSGDSRILVPETVCSSLNDLKWGPDLVRCLGLQPRD